MKSEIISFFDSTGQQNQMLQKPYSEATAKKIDERVSFLVENAYQRTKKLLEKHRSELDALAEKLLEKETVFKKDLKEIFDKPKVTQEE